MAIHVHIEIPGRVRSFFLPIFFSPFILSISSSFSRASSLVASVCLSAMKMRNAAPHRGGTHFDAASRTLLTTVFRSVGLNFKIPWRGTSGLRVSSETPWNYYIKYKFNLNIFLSSNIDRKLIDFYFLIIYFWPFRQTQPDFRCLRNCHLMNPNEPNYFRHRFDPVKIARSIFPKLPLMETYECHLKIDFYLSFSKCDYGWDFKKF